MQKKNVPDRQKELLAMLADLTGHLEAASKAEESAIHSLRDTLAGVLAGEDITKVKGNFYSPERSDLFFAGVIDPRELGRMKNLADRAVKEKAAADLRVFVRDIPIRTTQVAGSVPLWAGGAALEKTLGPFLSKDGRKIWFDFFRIEKLTALYISGQSEPAILFNVSLVKKFLVDQLPPVVDPLTTYHLIADSVWIQSRVLAPNAPKGHYTALRIKRGDLTLSAPPQIVDGRLTINPATVVTVALVLAQPTVTDADPSSPYGADARNAKLKLPEKLSFRFSGSGSKITAIEGRTAWTVYGNEAEFIWRKNEVAAYDPVLNRVIIPFSCSKRKFAVQDGDCLSPFHRLAGTADIQAAAWALTTAEIDITKPAPAAGIGGIAVRCQEGLTARWSGLQGGDVNLAGPYIICEPGGIGVTDVQAGNLYCNQEYKLWKDDVNPFGSSIKLQFTDAFPFLHYTLVNGNEGVVALANTNPLLDRPVTITGLGLDIHSKSTVFILAVHKSFKIVYLYDDNILFDNYDPNRPKETLPRPMALALNNALFKVTPVNGCLLFGELADDMVKVSRGVLFLTFGMYAYLPTLPDPYAADLNMLKFQFGRMAATTMTKAAAVESGQRIWLWLLGQVRWSPGLSDRDDVRVAFYFIPLQSQAQVMYAAAGAQETGAAARAAFAASPQTDISSHPFVRLFTAEQVGKAAESPAALQGDARLMMAAIEYKLPDYQAIWDGMFSSVQNDVFALLDVSSNANQMGVSFGSFGGRRMAMVKTHGAVAAEATGEADVFPLQVQGMDVVARGRYVRAFTLPLISWEPVFNLTEPAVGGDPPLLFNYYPDDGGPTRIMNDSVRLVPLAPIPVTDFLIHEFNTDPKSKTAALFTLPFALRAWAEMSKDVPFTPKPSLKLNAPRFENDLKGGIQIQADAGDSGKPQDSNMFQGYTLQINNLLAYNGAATGASTLGYSVTTIFNKEFYETPLAQGVQRGVPLTRIDFSGYGASIFSNWLSPSAAIAQTSQARFDVFVGRTSHEIIQVRSILYPWGIRVVRTITLFRVASGYVYRHDSGWRAESDGRYDFSYAVVDPNDDEKFVRRDSPYEIHPGVLKGLFNVKEIRETDEIQRFLSKITVRNGDTYINILGKEVVNTGNPFDQEVILQAVYVNADAEIEGVIQGHMTDKNHKDGLVPSKGILGFVQLAPAGQPLPPALFKQLLDSQLGSIGGPVNCVVDIGKNAQKLRVNRFDVNSSTDQSNVNPVFVAAARGSVILPKDGAWSVVMHRSGTGEVTPLPESLTAPLIRIGKLAQDLSIPDTGLLRIANPTELLRNPVGDTVNFGFLQSTNTQKVLFLTPCFEKLADETIPGKLLSKTPPLFADAYRLISSKGIFPNIGDAVTGFGDAIALTKDFIAHPSLAGVLQLMSINSADGVIRLVEDGYSLLNKIKTFDLPDTEWYLIKEDYLKVYVEYKAKTKNKDNQTTQDRIGSLNFDVNSFATEMADRWKSRLNNLAMVVDLGPFTRLMTIKGNFDAKKGSEAAYTGVEGDDDFPTPQIEFSDAIQPVIEILQILQDLQGGNYKAALQKGLKIAMSNSADGWEYKFEASKEIPVVKFPVPDEVYNNPTTPLKLEASFKVGVYFNAALTTAALMDPKKLLPTAGAYMDFYGRLSVMCVSISAATVYAVGQVDLKIAADTKVGPSLAMKFGFGAQIAVGLPVVGNVSVLYMVGVEVYADATKLNVSAYLLFQGHAEIFGGIVSVTITIEAKGTISRIGNRTDCKAQVTFGLDISIFLVINISFSESWEEQRQIA